MIIVNPCAFRMPLPQPHGLDLDYVIKEETYSSSVLDENGKPTDQLIQHKVNRAFCPTDMPIDQSITSDMFDIKIMVEQNVPLKPVTGFSFDSETPESVFGALSYAEQSLLAKSEQFKQSQSPDLTPDPEPIQEPKTE